MHHNAPKHLRQQRSMPELVGGIPYSHGIFKHRQATGSKTYISQEMYNRNSHVYRYNEKCFWYTSDCIRIRPKPTAAEGLHLKRQEYIIRCYSMQGQWQIMQLLIDAFDRQPTTLSFVLAVAEGNEKGADELALAKQKYAPTKHTNSCIKSLGVVRRW